MTPKTAVVVAMCVQQVNFVREDTVPLPVGQAKPTVVGCVQIYKRIPITVELVGLSAAQVRPVVQVYAKVSFLTTAIVDLVATYVVRV
jgi:hypothetical protein